MHLSVSELAGRATVVGIGEGRTGGPSDSYRATLGSCVGVCIVWAKAGIFGLAHVLLPAHDKPDEVIQTDSGSRYANTVVRWLIDQLEVPQRKRRELVAYVAGGASMFQGGDQQTHVGEENQRQLLQALGDAKVRVKGHDFGGEGGRQLLAHGPTRKVFAVSLESDHFVEWEMPANFQPPKEH